MSRWDLAAVQADDVLLDRLGRWYAAAELPEDRLARVLVAWRREVEADAVGELVDTDTALALVAAARRRRRRRKPVPAAVAAAALLVALSGVGLAARSAEPGDRLWGVTKVLYAEHARSVEAVESVDRELQQAARQLDQGRRVAAGGSLDRAAQQLRAVSDAERRAELLARHEQLMQRLLMLRPAGTSGADELSAEDSLSTRAPSDGRQPSQPAASKPAKPIVGVLVSDPMERHGVLGGVGGGLSDDAGLGPTRDMPLVEGVDATGDAVLGSVGVTPSLF